MNDVNQKKVEREMRERNKKRERRRFVFKKMLPHYILALVVLFLYATIVYHSNPWVTENNTLVATGKCVHFESRHMDLVRYNNTTFYIHLDDGNIYTIERGDRRFSRRYQLFKDSMEQDEKYVIRYYNIIFDDENYVAEIVDIDGQEYFTMKDINFGMPVVYGAYLIVYIFCMGLYLLRAYANIRE